MFGFIKTKPITFVEDTFKDIKPEVEDVVENKSTRFIQDVFNKLIEITQSSKETMKEISDESKEKIIPLVKDNVQNTLKKSYFDLIHWKGVPSKQVLKQFKKLQKIIT